LWKQTFNVDDEQAGVKQVNGTPKLLPWQQAVDYSTVMALIANLAKAIGVVLQLSPRIELLAPGPTIQMAAAVQTNKKCASDLFGPGQTSGKIILPNAQTGQ
jgi:hypothetical protein